MNQRRDPKQTVTEAKANLTSRWDKLTQWFQEGRTQASMAQELKLSNWAFNAALRALVRQGLPDPRPLHFSSRSLAFKISKDWDQILDRMKRDEPIEAIAASYSRTPQTLSHEINRVARLTSRAPMRMVLLQWRREQKDAALAPAQPA